MCSQRGLSPFRVYNFDVHNKLAYTFHEVQPIVQDLRVSKYNAFRRYIRLSTIHFVSSKSNLCIARRLVCMLLHEALGLKHNHIH